MGMQKASLLGDGGDAVTGTTNSESRARARRMVTPQREYPIFTPGFREPALYSGSRDPSCVSFQESEAPDVWKEIHTDTQSTDDGDSSHSLSFDTGHPLLTPSLSAASLDKICLKPRSCPDSPGADNFERPTIALSSTLSPTSQSLLPPGRISMDPGSSYFIPMSSPSKRNYVLPGGHTSPTRTGLPHSPQNVNILSPQLRPLEKSPKLTQLNITSPRLTANGGLSPMVDQLTMSLDQAHRLSHELSEPPSTSSNMFPAARTRSPHRVTSSSPVHDSIGTSIKMKKMLKSRHTDTSPRPSVSKDRSPGRAWKKSLRAVSPGLLNIKDEAQNAMKGLARDLGNSLHGSKGRANAAAACVNSSSAPSWGRCGDGQAMVAPALDRDRSESSSEFQDLSHKTHKKLTTVQKSGSYNIFSLLWGKKRTTPMKLSDSHQSDMGSVKADSDSIKVLDFTIKTLRYKLEQANKKRATAVDEVRALQSALEAAEEKYKQLQQRCQELELQLSARRSGLWDMEMESDNPTYIVGRRESGAGVGSTQGVRGRYTSLELTPQLFAKMFEDSKVCLRKLASSICHHIRDSGESATQVITSLLEQHKVGRGVSRMPRNVIILYFESFLNQVMFESFENVSFEPNGAASVFDPDTLKEACYQAYQDLRKQEWINIERSLGKPGSLVVNANFHRFFVVRMELILSQLGKLAENEIPLSLMASFFNAVKSVWLVHHLAVAFDQLVTIFRVAPSAAFDPRYMEQVTTFEEEPVRAKISIMVNPGFIVNRQTIKCQVFCSSKYQ